MKIDLFSAGKLFVQVGDVRVAYYEQGSGPALLLLHGCPFSSFVWRRVIPQLATSYRCLAPDLLGLGDTETPANADWSLRAQASMIIGFLDALSVARTHVVGHDHGGAIAQLLAAEHPNRLGRMVLSNVEAYDNWPSQAERPFVQLTQIPVLGDIVMWIWSWRFVLRATLAEARAVENRAVLTKELLHGYIRSNFSTRHRRAKTKRFLAGQFDSRNNRVTMELLEGLRRFEHDTILIWAQDDPHFGVEWAERLRQDIPGVRRLEVLSKTGHLLMEERPEEYSAAVSRFLAEPAAPGTQPFSIE